MPPLAPGAATLLPPLWLWLWLSCLALAAPPAQQAPGADANGLATCTDRGRNVTVRKGEALPLADGTCGRLWCEGGARRPRLVHHVCENAPHSSCLEEPGDPGAAYPACCNRITCSGHTLRHGKCVDPTTNTEHERGTTWPLPSGECGFVECMGYSFSARGLRPTWRLRKHSCARPTVTKPNCSYVEGVVGGVFPTCCQRVMCLVRPRSTASKENDSSGSIEQDG